MPPALAAARVWQPPQPLLAKTWAPGPPGTLGGAAPGTPAYSADVGGDVLEVLAGDDVGGHRDGGVVVARPRDTRPGPRRRPRSCRRPRRRRGRRRRRRRGRARSAPVVPAWAIAWQVPHFWMKRTRPRSTSALLVPQPEAGSATAARAARTSRGRMGFGELGHRAARSAPESICRGRRRKPLARAPVVG